MSWEALAWAKDSDIAHPVAKFILVLLANKADENFSCYPSIRTLMAESGAGRSTILRALSYLETRGFMSRRPQFHDSGARRSTRYYLNHPRAPHLPPGPDPGIPPSRSGTGPVSHRDGDGVKAAPPEGPTAGPLEPINRITIRTGRRRGTGLGVCDQSVEARDPRRAQSSDRPSSLPWRAAGWPQISPTF